MNKTLIITGGSKGIGRSIAIKFAQNNFDIYTCSRNEDELKKLEHDINSINSKIKVHTLKSDLSTKEGSLNFIDFVKKNTDIIDVLINNVGTFIPGKLIEEEDQTKPLSDSKIAAILLERDVKIARRTIAKYRESLGIPSSSERKKYAN